MVFNHPPSNSSSSEYPVINIPFLFILESFSSLSITTTIMSARSRIVLRLFFSKLRSVNALFNVVKSLNIPMLAESLLSSFFS